MLHTHRDREGGRDFWNMKKYQNKMAATATNGNEIKRRGIFWKWKKMKKRRPKKQKKKKKEKKEKKSCSFIDTGFMMYHVTSRSRVRERVRWCCFQWGHWVTRGSSSMTVASWPAPMAANCKWFQVVISQNQWLDMGRAKTHQGEITSNESDLVVMKWIKAKVKLTTTWLTTD